MQHMSFYTVKGWIFAVLFILTIPVSNWVVMNVGLVCTADGPVWFPCGPASWRRRAFFWRGWRSSFATAYITFGHPLGVLLHRGGHRSLGLFK